VAVARSAYRRLSYPGTPPAVGAVANGIAQEGCFADLPLLADARAEARGQEEIVLAPGRGKGPHARLPSRVTYRFQGLERRLTTVTREAQGIPALLA
jgi:hypothetical protein